MTHPLALHLEPTTRCTALCAQCLRRTAPAQVLCKDMNLDMLRRTVDFDKVTEVELSGNFGDPMCYPEIFDLLRFLHTHSIDVKLHTNGFFGDAAVWRELASFHNVRTVFAIDGVTACAHEANRIGTRFQVVLSNATAYCEAGGCGIWFMLLYKHNEYQWRDGLELAKSRGFTEFVAKTSDRFYSYELRDVLARIPLQDGSFLEPASKSHPQPELLSMHEAERSSYLGMTRVRCWYPRSVFIDAQLRAFPCCITAASVSEQELGLDVFEAIVRKHGIHTLRLLESRKLVDVLHGPIFTEFLQTLTPQKAQHGCKVCCGDKPCMPRVAYREILR